MGVQAGLHRCHHKSSAFKTWIEMSSIRPRGSMISHTTCVVLSKSTEKECDTDIVGRSEQVCLLPSLVYYRVAASRFVQHWHSYRDNKLNKCCLTCLDSVDRHASAGGSSGWKFWSTGHTSTGASRWNHCSAGWWRSGSPGLAGSLPPTGQNWSLTERQPQPCPTGKNS